MSPTYGYPRLMVTVDIVALPWFVTYTVSANDRAAVPTLTDSAMGVLDRR